MREELHRHATGAQRDGCRDVRQLVGAGRELERAAADVEEQDLSGRPAEPATDGEEREAGLGLSAQHLERLSEGRLDARDDVCAVRGFAHGRGRRREQLGHVLDGGDLAGLRDGGDERRDPFVGDGAVRREVAHEPQHRPPTRRRQRTTAGSNVGDQQMDGVRADVEDSEAHASG